VIHLLPGSTDEALASELRESGILTPDVIERIDAALGRPEHCDLDDFLLSGAEIIKAADWLSWLIRRHGCHRFGRVAWHEDAREWLRGGMPDDLNLPYRRCADGRPLVAVLRPDKVTLTVERMRKETPVWAAATLAEVRALKIAWERQTAEMEAP
jgi:hypothetical protein